MHGFENEFAHIRKEVSFEKAASGFMVADPLTLYDCCPTSDGASCVILAADHIVREFTDDPIWLKGSGAGSDHLALHDRHSITQMSATQNAVAQAYKSSGVSATDIDLAEVHDCFTIAELMATEDLGFANRGEGGLFARQGRGRRNEGDVAINPSGGLKSKGHPNLWEVRPGDIIEYDGKRLTVLDAQHRLSNALSNFTFLSTDTGLEGVLQNINQGSVATSSKRRPDKTNQITDENFSFFDSLEIIVTPTITVTEVSHAGFLIGGNSERGVLGGNNETIGLVKKESTTTEGES